jgi:hypothetical protein
MIIKETKYKSTEMSAEIRPMVTKPEFTGQKEEFSNITDNLVKKGGTTGDKAWDIVLQKIVQFLPDYITECLIHCSLEKIGALDECRNAAVPGKKRN